MGENAYAKYIETLNGEMSTLRSLLSSVADMREKCYDLELSIASLNNPELVDKKSEAETVMQETESQFKALLDATQELNSNPVIKSELHETEADASGLLGTNESCEGTNGDDSSSSLGDQDQPHPELLNDSS